MKYEEILRDIKNKIYHPIYLLQGEEPYFIDKISNSLEKTVLTEAEKGFNQTILYGKDVNWKNLLDTVRRYPMMSNYQVVILKEAQQMRDFDKLAEYFENPSKSTVFVICYKYKTLDKRKSVYKTIVKNAVVFDSKRLYDNQIPAFINNTISGLNHQISTRASALLAEYLGNDLSKIEKELEKLALNVPEGETISPEHIEQFIGISKDYNVFELTNALAERDSKRAYRIVDYFNKNPKPNPAIKVIGTLFSFFNKALVIQRSGKHNQKEVNSILRIPYPMQKDLNTYQRNYSAKDTVAILDILQEYDLKSKGVDYTGSNKNVLLTEMVYRILN